MKEPSKEDSQFTHPLKRGWLLPYLLELSDMFDGRWTYWFRNIDKGRPLDGPIPKIKFNGHPHNEAGRNIKDCILHIQRKGYGVYDAWTTFIDWLLWGFGAKIQDDFPAKVDEDISWYWYRTFNLGLLMKFPSDYMAWGSCELAGMSYSGNKTGYFPTPGNVVKMMVDMQMTGDDKTKTVSDCCLGTGTFLLYASNYSLRLYGQDISLNMCKMATVNAYIYIPWMAFPAYGMIDWNTIEDYKAAIAAIEKIKGAMKTPLLSYTPKTNTLADWI